MIFFGVKYFTLFGVLAGVNVAAPSPIDDHPIAASGPVAAVTGFTALGRPRTRSTCHFQPGIDYAAAGNKSSGTRITSVANERVCCDKCGSTPGCVVAVFVAMHKPGECWLKSASDSVIAFNTTRPGRMSCRPHAQPGPGPEPQPTFVIPATVPGDLLTDLHAANLIGDPLLDTNFLNASLWDDDYWWTFVANFTTPPDGEHRLVFDGIKMAARISVDGQVLGTVHNQFRRFVFPVSGNSTAHHVEVAFDPTLVMAGNRYMACSGGWDWAPYTQTCSNDMHMQSGGAATFSKGLWKRVYVLTAPTGTATINHIVPQIHYLGDYPTTPLTSSTHAGFRVDVRVFVQAPETGAQGTLKLSTEWGATAQASVDLRDGSEQVVTLSTAATDVELWWPNGVQGGGPKLYNLTVTFEPDARADTVPAAATRRVGFRHFALVTGHTAVLRCHQSYCCFALPVCAMPCWPCL